MRVMAFMKRFDADIWYGTKVLGWEIEMGMGYPYSKRQYHFHNDNHWPIYPDKDY